MPIPLPNLLPLLLLLLTLFLPPHFAQGSKSQRLSPLHHHYHHQRELVNLQEEEEEEDNVGEEEGINKRKSRRVMIGSTRPTCTYNECRGCKYRCRAEQVPVEGNDPINSAYHYRCVCHRALSRRRERSASEHMESGPKRET